MARVTGPLFSLRAYGSVSKTLTFRRSPTGIVARAYSEPTGLPSIFQSNLRELFASIKPAWDALSDEQRETFNQRARLLAFSGFNLFSKEYFILHKGELYMTVGLIPIGGLLAFLRDLTGTPVDPPAEFLSCDGQDVADPESPLFGIILPDLNRTGIFLRGDQVSGTTGGTLTHTHTTPAKTTSGPSANSVQPGSGAVTVPTNAHTHTVSSGTSGSSDTIPPFYTVVWYIRIK